MKIIKDAKTPREFITKTLIFSGKIYAICFMVGSSLFLWRVMATAVLNGGYTCLNINVIGEQNLEIAMGIIGLLCMLFYLPKLVKAIITGKT